MPNSAKPMKPLRLATVLMLAAGAGCGISGCAATQAADPAGQAAACQTDPAALLQQFADAFNQHDAARLAGLFADRANFVNIYGTVMRNRSGIEQGHAQAFSSRLAPAKLEFRSIDKNQASDRTAVLTGVWDLVQPNDADQTKVVPTGSGALTAVAQCDDTRWVLISGANVRKTTPPS